MVLKELITVCAPASKRGAERREVDGAEGLLREVHGVVIPAPLPCPVGDPVLGAGQDPIGSRGIVALKPSNAGSSHGGTEVGILAGPLRDPSPARIAGDVDHGGKSPLEPGGRGLRRRDPRGALDGRRVPATCFTQRNWEDRAVTMDHVEAEDQGDLQPRLLDRHALGFVDIPGPPDIQERADQALRNQAAMFITDPPGVGDGVELLQLADLLREGHPCEQVGHALLDLLSRWQGPGRDRRPGHDHHEEERP